MPARLTFRAAGAVLLLEGYSLMTARVAPAEQQGAYRDGGDEGVSLHARAGPTEANSGRGARVGNHWARAYTLPPPRSRPDVGEPPLAHRGTVSGGSMSVPSEAPRERASVGLGDVAEVVDRDCELTGLADGHLGQCELALGLQASPSPSRIRRAVLTSGGGGAR